MAEREQIQLNIRIIRHYRKERKEEGKRNSAARKKGWREMGKGWCKVKMRKKLKFGAR